ncbi:hypothetical protein [Filimonas effusa]|uniref:Uncharacterized protein n=1 Tax=Filimonas effusa TaxID=2508721 RepID=A0A4Q1D2W9_9BACT|nr:hypothetical protein [Filimonas effusa]RXK81742.1 hypothetical protein ESB13_18285 [Filimonas effusa]
MGEVLNNDFVMGSSGLTGNMLVYRQRKGRTFIAKRPQKRKKPFTEEELQHQALFADAITYARAAIVDPAVKEIYAFKAKGIESAYNVAVRNFYDLPEVKLVDVSGYNGSIGSKILVKATDKCKVNKVKIVIKSSAGSIIEQGEAVVLANDLDWIYTATTLNSSPSGSTVTATAFNLPGNSANSNKVV